MHTNFYLFIYFFVISAVALARILQKYSRENKLKVFCANIMQLFGWEFPMKFQARNSILSYVIYLILRKCFQGSHEFTINIGLGIEENHKQ